jgi:hypothetical protein
LWQDGVREVASFESKPDDIEKSNLGVNNGPPRNGEGERRRKSEATGSIRLLGCGGFGLFMFNVINYNCSGCDVQAIGRPSPVASDINILT